MPDDTTLITLELEGLPQEQGHLRLGDFLSYLHALRGALQSVDKILEESAETNIYYRIVRLSHSSPIRIVLEPVSTTTPGEEGAVDVRELNALFIQGLEAVSKNQPLSPYIDTHALESFRRLAEPQGKTFSRAVIYSDVAKVNLDEKFKEHVSALLEKEYYSFGSLVGRLEKINLHGRANTFWIYPTVGAREVWCRFLPDLKERAKQALDKVVRVRGRKAYRPNANFPYRIDVHDMDEVYEQEAGTHLVDLAGIARAVPGAAQSVEVIKELIDDEWE